MRRTRVSLVLAIPDAPHQPSPTTRRTTMPAPAGRKDDDTPEAAARALREESAPPVKPKSSLWQALANLSIGRSTDREKSADIVHKGETGTLTRTEERR